MADMELPCKDVDSLPYSMSACSPCVSKLAIAIISGDDEAGVACVGHEGPAEEGHGEEEVVHDEEEEGGHDEEVVVRDEVAPEAEADVVAAHRGGDEGRVVVEGCASS
ncbi:hypothetical protein SO802_000704 [Lithocarpus litseifolius]|uniref:Uncharacterized protein n=1 Tax=Lithocarpus litseifolius TaxID=425828 RepID=A0AAW2DS91_9ROSI